MFHTEFLFASRVIQNILSSLTTFLFQQNLRQDISPQCTPIPLSGKWGIIFTLQAM
jgi:hypothetical protein